MAEDKKDKKKNPAGGITINALVELKEKMLEKVAEAIGEFETSTQNIVEVQGINITRKSSVGENDQIQITSIVDADIKFRL